MTIEDKRQRYEYVYDALCDFLDNRFRENNYCDFVDSKCAAMRKYAGPKEDFDTNVGCCISFDWVGRRAVHNHKTCKHLVNKTCDTKCLACKFYTCDYLRDKGVVFDMSEFPEVMKVFNKKQITVLIVNLFHSKEDIIDRLIRVEKMKLPFFLFEFFNVARIQ